MSSDSGRQLRRFHVGALPLLQLILRRLRLREILEEFLPASGRQSASSAYYGFRFYEPHLQRWINRDPLGEPGFELLRGKPADVFSSGPGLDQFVANDPVGFYDEDGLIFRAIKAWRCRRKMNKWYQECIRIIPPCTRGINTGACPSPADHYFKCEVTRVEKIAECAKDAQEVFDTCMGVTTSPQRPGRL